MEPLTKPITQLNGPANFYKFTAQDKTLPTIYFIGDIHFSKKNGCSYDGQCVKLNAARNNLDKKSLDKSCIDLDLAVHAWLLYNNATGVTTDFFIETPLKKQLTTGLRGAKGIENNDKTGWIGSTNYVIEPCFSNKKKCPYGPSSRVHYTDVRGKRQGVTTEIFTGIYEMLNLRVSALELIEPLIYVANSVDRIWQAYLRPGSLRVLEELRQEILKLKTTETTVSLALLFEAAYLNFGTAKEYKGNTGNVSRVRMHRIAWQLYKLNSRDAKGKELAVKLYKFAIAEVEVKKKELKALVEVLSSLDEEDADLQEEIVSKIAGVVLFIGVLAMDVYALSRALYYNNKVCIFHTGVAHTRNYVTFTRDYLGYVEEFGVDNTLDFFDEETGYYEDEGIVNASRCISSDQLPRHLDFATMLRYLTKKGILEAAQYRFEDMERY